MTARERIAAAAVLIAGAALRLYDLTLKPFHHDEGVNGFFMTRLVREGVYKYDPQNYHGPSLYYLDLPLIKLFGFDSFALRLLPALFGIGVIVLLLMLGKRLGRWTALSAAALVAVSPGMVFISRYFIHEMMVVFFTFGIIVAVLWYRDRHTMWRLFAVAASAGFLFATKETAAPTVVVLLIAWVMTWGLMKWTEQRALPAEDAGGARRKKKRKKSRAQEQPPGILPRVQSASEGSLTGGDSAAEYDDQIPPHRDVALLMWSIVVFVAVNAFLFSSFFSNKEGLMDAIRSLMFWTSTGKSAHVHPPTQYAIWMLRQEGAIFVLGCAGIVLAIMRRTNALAVFCAFWALGMFSMYSLIPYKTPWLGINIALPFAVMAGWALQEAADYIGDRVALVILLAAVAIGTTQCLSLNFRNYDDNSEKTVYIYAHTVRDVYRLLHDVDLLASRAQGPETQIMIVAKNYWPLPWYMRNYKAAQFFGKMAPIGNAPLVISEKDADGDQDPEVRQSSGGQLTQIGSYTLRPGVNLILWARTSLGTP